MNFLNFCQEIKDVVGKNQTELSKDKSKQSQCLLIELDALIKGHKDTEASRMTQVTVGIL